MSTRPRWLRRTGSASSAGANVLVDALTGLGTRRAMRAAVGALVRDRRPGALALLEVDGFRALTLRRTSSELDRILVALGTRLHELEPGRGFHLGDGSFAAVLPSAGDLLGWAEHASGALGVLDREVSVSVGIARVEAELSPADVEARARSALRTARRRGNGSCVDAASDPDPAGEEVTPAQARALYDVLDDGYLRVHYQPIVDLRDGRTIAFEALARPQATHGLTGPLEAFEVARKLGLVPELDAVCRASILAEGPGFDMPPHARLHLNLSPLSLGHRSLAASVLRQQLDGAGLEPRRVVLEVTEEQDAEPAVLDRELRRLAQTGFTVLLDEVGTGSGGLRRLGTGRYQALKIAQDVIAATSTSAHAVGIVEAVCAFARHTRMGVIAAGVADEQLLRFVQGFRSPGHPGWRIPAAQGFHLGRPRPHARGDQRLLDQKQAAASQG